MTSQPFEASEFHVQNWPFLDGLRGVALLIVLGLHARLPFLAGGIYGVDIFFVMSGFLITVLLMDEWHRTQGINLRAFYIRRALRLVPALLAMAAICCVYAFVYLDPASAASVYSGAKYAVLYFTNWASVLGWVGLTIFSATWSLAIEEQFYLLWPIILIVLLRLRCGTKTKTLLIAGGAMSSMLWRLYLAHRDGFTVRELVGIDARADGLLLGAALGAALYWGLVPRGRWMRRLLTIAWIASIAFFAIVLPIPYSTASLAWMISLYVLASASIILALLHSPPRMLRAVLEARALQWVGKRAYGLYLWQIPVIALPLPIIGRALPNPTWPAAIPQTVMRVALTFLIAAASYRWIELPFLRLKDRWSRLPRNEGVTPAAEIASVPATAALG